MTIKLIAFDFDGVIPLEESPQYLLEKLGLKKENDALSAEFYAGLAAAKTDAERDLVPARVWAKSFALYQRFPVRRMKKVIESLPLILGSKETFNYCKEKGIKTAILSATIIPLLKWNLSKHDIAPDFIFGSECTIKNGRFERLLFVLSPQSKRLALENLLRQSKILPSECLVVGDSFSEVPMFRLVGKKNSIAFHYRQDISEYCDHLLFKQNDADRNLSKIIDVVEKFK
ncbi:MAG: HAD-IB family phosphatase [Candidatus Micrarchaeota archaeon]